MTTGEDQAEALVGDFVDIVNQGRKRPELLGLFCLHRSEAVASQAINCAVPGRGDDPRRRIIRDAARRPSAERLFEGVLDSLLSQVEAAGRTDKGGDRPPRLMAEQEVDVPDLIVRASALRLLRKVLDRTQLDRAVHGAGTTGPCFDRLVQVGDIEYVVAAKLFLGLREGSI